MTLDKAARESHLRAAALERVLSAVGDREMPVDPALVNALLKLAGAAAAWASVAEQAARARR